MRESLAAIAEDITDAPTPWSVVPVDLGNDRRIYHLVDARSHTLISSTGVNGRGPELQRRMLERIAAAINATSPAVEALARTVVREDERGVSASTRRHHASSLLAQSIVLGTGLADAERRR